jgi:hypothetical protein
LSVICGCFGCRLGRNMLLCLTLYYFVFQGLFKPSYLFFALFLGHIMVLEVLSYLTLYYFGTGWLPFIVSILLYSTPTSLCSFSLNCVLSGEPANTNFIVFGLTWLDHSLTLTLKITSVQTQVCMIKVITKLPNSEQSYKGKVQTHNYINRQNG